MQLDFILLKVQLSSLVLLSGKLPEHVVPEKDIPLHHVCVSDWTGVSHRRVSSKYLLRTLSPQHSVFIFIFYFCLKLSRLPANCTLPALDHQPDPESHFFIYWGRE